MGKRRKKAVQKPDPLFAKLKTMKSKIVKSMNDYFAAQNILTLQKICHIRSQRRESSFEKDGAKDV